MEKLIKTLCATPIYFAKDEALFQPSDKPSRSVNDPEINSLCWGSDGESDKKNSALALFKSRERKFIPKISEQRWGQTGEEEEVRDFEEILERKTFFCFNFFLVARLLKAQLGGREKGDVYRNRQNIMKAIKFLPNEFLYRSPTKTNLNNIVQRGEIQLKLSALIPLVYNFFVGLVWLTGTSPYKSSRHRNDGTKKSAEESRSMSFEIMFPVCCLSRSL